MNETQKSIQHARPLLRLVSPLAHWIVFILALFNIVLGCTLFFALDQSRFTASLLIVNNIFTFQFWGVVFVALGLFKFWSLLTNNWRTARASLLIGVVIKSSWAITLTVRTFVSPGTLFLNFIWIALALVQAMTYIFFMPPSVQPEIEEKIEGIGHAK